MKVRIAPCVVGLFLCMAIVGPPRETRGDVLVERFNKSGGIGGMGANESAVVQKLSGQKKHETSDFKMTGAVGGFLGKMAGGMGSDVITDIDKDVIWTLDHKKKSYTESRITLPKEKEKEERAGKAEEGKETKEDKAKTRVVRSEISVKETGEKKTINGFDCVHYVVTWLIEKENIETKERSKTTMTNDLWNTPETKEIRALQKEELEFSKAYMKKVGITASPEDGQKFGMADVAGIVGEDEQAMQKKLKELQDKKSKIKGFPIVTAVKWEKETPEGSRQAKKEQAEKEEEPDLSGGIGGFLGGLAKKTVKQKAAESAKKDAKAGTVLSDIYSEIKKIDVSSIPSSAFEVPPGYKQAK